PSARPPWRRAITAGVVTLLGGGSAAAQDAGVAFAGLTVDGDRSIYAGAVAALAGSSLGHGLAARGVFNAGEYRYRAGGKTIEADQQGVSAALVMQRSGTAGWANFGLGVRYTALRL